MPAYSDLVHETTTSTGTGNLTVASVFGKRTFNTAFSTGGSNLFDYYISHRTAAEWERGTGHLSAATTFVRDTVLASSNANALVNFTAGTKDVSNDQPAGKRVDGPIGGSNTQVQFNNSSAFGGSANLTWSSPALTIGAAGATGQLKLAGTSSGVVTIQPQSVAGTYNFNLPASAGSAGQPMLSGGGAGTAMAFGTLQIANGGTGQTTAALALGALNGVSKSGGGFLEGGTYIFKEIGVSTIGWAYFGSADRWIGFSNNDCSIGSTANTGMLSLASTAASTSTTTGALVVTGGVGIGGALNVGAGANIANSVSIAGASPSVTINATSGSSGVYFQASGTTQWSIMEASGILYIRDTDASHGVSIAQNASAWAAVSDARAKVKHNIVTVLDKLDDWHLYDFTWKRGGKRDVGVFAQDAHRCFPVMVNRGDDDPAYVPTGLGDPRAWTTMRDYAGLFALTGVKELRDRIAALEERINGH